MPTDYEYTMARPSAVKDQPVNPPELSEEDYERNCRNMCRESAIEALRIVISRLEELDDDESISYMEIVLDNLKQGMED